MSTPAVTTTKNTEENPKETEDDRSVCKDVEDEETHDKVDDNKTGEESKDVASEEKQLVSGPNKRKAEDEGDRLDAKRVITETGVKDVSVKSSTATDNTVLVQDYYNTQSKQDVGNLDQRNESRILYMRNFNNWIKTMLINEYLGQVKKNKVFGSSLKVMDMCCGKGGDLLKWRRADINHLICADISDLSIEHCEKRYNDMSRRGNNDRGFSSLFTAEFITADCTKVRLRERFSDASIQLDFVSCQFAFHYCFESLQQAECMLRNASESLKPGGYFIGTMPDANDLVSRWQKAEGNRFGNDVYSVEFTCESKEKPALFGCKYNFHLEGVVDCPEFLVHVPTFCKLALKFGLKLVKFERFDDYYERMKNEGRSLLGKMQALETYPPQRDSPLVGQSTSEYEHAAEYVANCNKSNSVKIGTISQSEWEVISLYAVFAFQKMKTNWNSEGKPEYEDL